MLANLRAILPVLMVLALPATALAGAENRAPFSLVDQTGRIVTPQGNEVLGQGGPLTIPLQDSKVVIARDGTISSRESGEIGRIRVVQFADDQQLRQSGIGLYMTDLPPRTHTGPWSTWSSPPGQSLSL